MRYNFVSFRSSVLVALSTIPFVALESAVAVTAVGCAADVAESENVGEAEQALLCQDVPGVCEDYNPCTTDVCQRNGSCSHNPKPDGWLCFGLPTDQVHGECVSGICRPTCGANGECPDSMDPCWHYACNFDNVCVPTVATPGTPCPGGTCNNGVCQ